MGVMMIIRDLTKIALPTIVTIAILLSTSIQSSTLDKAFAHTLPPGATMNANDFSLGVFRADGITPVLTSNPPGRPEPEYTGKVIAGETINYKATLKFSSVAGASAFENGFIIIAKPGPGGSSFCPASGPVPLIDDPSDMFTSALCPYVVNPNHDDDFLGPGDSGFPDRELTAEAAYSGGIAHLPGEPFTSNIRFIDVMYVTDPDIGTQSMPSELELAKGTSVKDKVNVTGTGPSTPPVFPPPPTGTVTFFLCTPSQVASA